MLGNFGIYSQFGSFWFRESAPRHHPLRFLLGIQPHEIAALNAGAAKREPETHVAARPREQRRAA